MIRPVNINIYPRGAAGGTYYAVICDGKKRGRPFSLGTKDQREAEAWRDEEIERLRAEAREGISFTRSTMAFDEAWQEYEKLPAIAHKSCRTVDHEKHCFNAFQRWCAANSCTTIGAVTTSLIKEYRRHLQRQKNLTTLSVNGYIASIKVVWTYLIQEDIYGGDNPFLLVQSLKQPRREVKSRGWEEVQDVLTAAKSCDCDLALFIILGAYLGIRRREILRARWEHIDWDARTFTIHKTKPRTMQYTVNMYPEFLRELLPYRAATGYIVKPEITDYIEGVGLRWDCNHELVKLFRAINKERPLEQRVKPFSPHQLRHTLITHLRSLGWSLPDIAAFVCQNETAITERYGEAGPELRRATLKISLREQVG